MNRLTRIMVCVLGVAFFCSASAPNLVLHERSRAAGRGGQTVTRTAEWDPKTTAVIITDMWDKHWCDVATARVAEMAPAINNFVSIARAKGVFIVHAPSETMDFYRDAPGRKLAQNAPRAANLPSNINDRCLYAGHKFLGERGVYHLDGGCSAPCGDRPCMQHTAWKRQISTIEIQPGDAISDSGEEIWNLFQQRGIKHVMLVGVHTNMCIINRPFGLCNWKRQGVDAVLVRDLTDSMYNPQKPPHVDHFTGTDRIIAYIEKYLAPTVLSTDITGAAPFRFKDDKRTGER